MTISFDNYSELGSLAEFRNGINFNKDNFGKGVKVIGVANFQSRTTPVYEELSEINPEGVVTDDDYLRENDIVFVRSNGSPDLVGRCLLIRNVTEKITFSGFTIRLRFISSETDPLFYTYLFQSPFFRRLISLQGSGTNIRNLSQSLLKAIQVPILPLREQRKIAEILSTWDEAIDLTEQLIAAKQRRKQALMQRLLTGQVRFVEFQQSDFHTALELTQTPYNWQHGRFCDIAVVEMGQSPPGDSYNNVGRGVPLINGPTEFTTRFPVKMQWTTMPTKVCKPGDILLCVRGSSTGRINIANDQYCIGRGIAAIRSHLESKNTQFLEYLLSASTNQILTKTAGSTFPNIDKKSLESIPVLIPPPEEQRKIATVLGACDEELDLHQQKLTALRRQKQGLMQQLLTGRLRVKV